MLMFDVASAWAAIETKEGIAAAFQLRLRGDSGLDLFAIVDQATGKRGIQLQVRSSSIPSLGSYPSSAAIRVKVERVQQLTRISILLERPEFKGVFAQLANDVFSACCAVAPDETQAVRVLVERLSTWKELFRDGGPRPLSEAEQLGLVGELLFVERLLMDGANRGAVVNGWRGPLFDSHDFRFGKLHVEVKATGGGVPYLARIANLQQLDPAGLDALHLWHWRLMIGAEGPTLPGLVHHVRTLLADDPARSVFDALLLKARYFSDHAEHYLNAYVHLGDGCWVVSDAFPALTRANVPAVVRDAAYTIALEMIPDEFACSREALLKDVVERCT